MSYAIYCVSDDTFFVRLDYNGKPIWGNKNEAMKFPDRTEATSMSDSLGDDGCATLVVNLENKQL